VLQGEQEEKQKLLWLLRKNELCQGRARKITRDIDKAQTDLEEQTAQVYATSRLSWSICVRRTMQRATACIRRRARCIKPILRSVVLEAQIKFVIESRSRLQTQLNSLSAQRDQWQRQSTQFQEELAQAELICRRTPSGWR
jgi:chromosome segregation protein